MSQETSVGTGKKLTHLVHSGRPSSPCEDREARDQMICQHLGLVQRLAKKFRQRGVPYEDLVQVGSLGLIKAVDGFDPSNGAQFTTFAAHYIVGEIKHHFRDKGWHLKVSRQQKRALHQVKEEIEYLTHSLQRSPTISEIAKELEMSEEEVIETLELKEAYAPCSLDEPLGEDNDNLLSVLAFRHHQNFEKELVQKITLDEAAKILTNREQRIVTLRYQYGMSQSEIAHRLEISQMQVSRLLKLSLEKMEQNLHTTTHRKPCKAFLEERPSDTAVAA